MTDKFFQDTLKEFEEPIGSFDAGDKRAVNNARKKAARERAEELEFVKAILTVPQGRKWMYAILERCHCYHQSFQPGMKFQDVAFNEGQRSIGNKLLADAMESDEEHYLLMVREGNKRKQLEGLKADADVNKQLEE